MMENEKGMNMFVFYRISISFKDECEILLLLLFFSK